MTAVPSKLSKFMQRYRVYICGAATVLLFGTVEMSWITIYHNLSGGDAVAVASGVTEAMFITRLPAEVAVPLGIAIETGVAIMFGVAIYFAVSSLPRRTASALLDGGIVIGSLVFVWSINLYLMLPMINPDFTAVIPRTTSVTFDVLFGSVAALLLYLCDIMTPDTSAVQGKAVPSTVNGWRTSAYRPKWFAIRRRNTLQKR